MTQTEAKWTERVRAWRSSGKTAEQFAEGEGYKAATLRVWASRVGASPSPSSVRLVHLRRSGEPASEVVVVVGGARIEVRAGFDPALLGEVVAALEGARR